MPEPVVRNLLLVAVGDVLPHRRVKATAKQKGWDFLFSAVAPVIRQADIAFANLESPVAPDHHKGIYGEVFNAPATLIPGLSDAGFDVLSMANNHVWDQGADGMLETMNRVEDASLVPVGVGRTCDEAKQPKIVQAKGVKVAFIAFTDLMNTDKRDKTACNFVPGKLCKQNCLPDRDALYFPIEVAQVHSAIAAAEELADVVVVSAHWQTEYHTEPLANYRPIARGFIEAGADVVLGHHPHVLQTVEQVGDGVVAYSLGNFVSDMGRKYTPSHPVRKGDTRDGGILSLNIEVIDESVKVVPAFLPTWTDNQALIRVVPLDQAPASVRAIRKRRIEEVVGPVVR